MADYVCPICGANYKEIDFKRGYSPQDPCRVNIGPDADFVGIYCHHYKFRIFLHQEIYCMEQEELKEKLMNLTVEHLIHSPMYIADDTPRIWYFYYTGAGEDALDGQPNYVNLAAKLNNYPEQAIDIAHRSLVNYAIRYPHYGDIICPNSYDRRTSFEHELNNNYRCGVIQLLVDLGYVKDPQDNYCYTITAEGWQKIDELRKTEQVVQQGFIAMSFREETKPIREAFRTAIKESGYSECAIDEKEHNNQIVPEIFYEIERSKFVVVDVTYPNYGAYYEAGYAQALGKQVIICCRKAEFDDKENKERPHFDIAQKAMVVWENENDLVRRLKKRIEATVK